MRLIKRNPFLLLEVLIAFTFVVSSFFPLVYPHFYIYQQQRRFINQIEVDLLVGNLFGLALVNLQTNKISWQEIEEGHQFNVQDLWVNQKESSNALPFTGVYQFKVLKNKKNDSYGLYLVELTFYVNTNQKDIKDGTKKLSNYTYKIFISRLFSNA